MSNTESNIELKQISELMLQAADELNKYIEAANVEIRRGVSACDEDEPSYHDAQTCHELLIAARDILKLSDN